MWSSHLFVARCCGRLTAMMFSRARRRITGAGVCSCPDFYLDSRVAAAAALDRVLSSLAPDWLLGGHTSKRLGVCAFFFFRSIVSDVGPWVCDVVIVCGRRPPFHGGEVGREHKRVSIATLTRRVG